MTDPYHARQRRVKRISTVGLSAIAAVVVVIGAVWGVRAVTATPPMSLEEQGIAKGNIDPAGPPTWFNPCLPPGSPVLKRMEMTLIGPFTSSSIRPGCEYIRPDKSHVSLDITRLTAKGIRDGVNDTVRNGNIDGRHIFTMPPPDGVGCRVFIEVKGGGIVVDSTDYSHPSKDLCPGGFALAQEIVRTLPPGS